MVRVGLLVEDCGVAKQFKLVDRDQVFLVPPDMRDWLPEEHLVWFLLDVVDELDIGVFVREYRLGGVGREAFDPRMMIALLAYAYCGGVRSSRAIERACHVDVAFRVVCAQQVPDHSVIARFRARHAAALAGLFAQVLLLCAKAGLGRVGVVAIDGTKIAANASLDQNRTREWFGQQASQMLAEAAAVDAAEDAAERSGEQQADRLPVRWRDRSGRRGRIKSALAEIEAYDVEQDRPVREAEQRAETARREYEQVQADRAAKIAAEAAAPRRRPGRPVDPDREETEAMLRVRRRVERAAKRAQVLRAKGEKTKARRANATDPQSRIMKTRQGWVQGYNNQTAVSQDGIILATSTSNDPADTGQFIPIMDAAVQATSAMGAAVDEPDRRIGLIVADAGYFSEVNLQVEGPDRLIAAGKKELVKFSV